MSYLNLYRIEMKDIVSIVEQKRYYGDNNAMNYVSVSL
jgi:V/A-type H+-transporting ATPase subunit C